jgi:hypothetical protein
MWDAGRRVKQRTEHIVESMIRPEGDGQNRQNEAREQQRQFFHMIVFPGRVFISAQYPWPEQIFLVERLMLTTKVYVSLHHARRAIPNPKFYQRRIRYRPRNPSRS